MGGGPDDRPQPILRPMTAIWIDVSMATGLQGSFHPFTEIKCDPPEPVPDASAGWQQWAAGQLATVAGYESWQPGRYSYTVAQRDESDRPLEVFTRGLWELVP